MNYKSIIRKNYFRVLVLLFIILVPVYFLFLSKNSKGSNLTNDEMPKTSFGGYMYDRFVPEFITFSDTGFYSTYIEFNEKGTTESIPRKLFIARKSQNENYIVYNENFLTVESKSQKLTLVKVNFPFLNKKDNLYPYLHPLLAIKMLHIFSKVKYIPRFSDAMRSDEQQNKYKRRGWSNVSLSPHMLGLAFDIGKFSWEDKKLIQKITEELGSKFLQHGGKRNNHIHIQEQKIWENIADKIKIDSVSTALTQKITGNYAFFEVQKQTTAGAAPSSANLLNISFYPEKSTILKVIIRRSFYDKACELTTGVFESGKQRTFSLSYDFLPAGNYIASVYLNDKLVLTKTIIKV